MTRKCVAAFLALGRPGNRVGGAEALSEDAAQIKQEAHGEARVGKPEALEPRLGQDERLCLLERHDICRAGEPVEESNLTEEVAGLEHPNALRLPA